MVQKIHPRYFSFSLVVLLILLVALLAGCGRQDKQTAKHNFEMASTSDMPAEVKAAPVVVQQAYQFAAANPDILTHIPCYCGCGDMGHTSNYACYISGLDANGEPTYDTHALGCSICVDITQDAMRMLKDGKSQQDIRAYVDNTYSKYGPSNIP